MPLKNPHSDTNTGSEVATTPWGNQTHTSSSIGNDDHKQLWDAIQWTTNEIVRQTGKIKYIEDQFRSLVVPREHRSTAALLELTQSLITIFSLREGQLQQQSLLGLWITENLQTLASHPFADSTQQQQTLQHWLGLLSETDAVDNHLIKLAQERFQLEDLLESVSIPNVEDITREQPESDPILDDDDIIFDFGWHKKEPRNNKTSEAQNQRTHSKQEKPRTGQSSSNNSEKNVRDENLKSLTDTVSIDRIFRQLAKVLHPDKEMDETIKRQKHDLMSQCLKARQRQDIHTLITLYCEHIGELPTDLYEDCDQDLLKALRIQLKELQLKLANLRQDSVLQSRVIDRYYANDQHDIEQQFSFHCKSLDNEANRLTQIIKDISSSEGLLAVLQKRREIEFDKMTIAELTGSGL